MYDAWGVPSHVFRWNLKGAHAYMRFYVWAVVGVWLSLDRFNLGEPFL